VTLALAVAKKPFEAIGTATNVQRLRARACVCRVERALLPPPETRREEQIMSWTHVTTVGIFTVTLALASGCKTRSGETTTTGAEKPAATAPSGSAQPMEPMGGPGMGRGMEMGLGPGGMGAMMGPMGPMHVAGTTVSAVDVPGGAALDFENAAHVDDVRARVRSVAAHRRMTGTTTSIVDTPHGARLVCTPTDPAKLEELRSQLRMQAEHMMQVHTAP
jgi:hypothetical protein